MYDRLSLKSAVSAHFVFLLSFYENLVLFFEQKQKNKFFLTNSNEFLFNKA